MQSVEIEFSNIQSHEHTIFTLTPGLNFILADDNNVGKSTIFKVLSFVSRMPNVNLLEANELLRVNSNRGYASFKYEDSHVVLWLIRDGGDRVRSFFEIYDGNTTMRELSCPAELLSALGIVVGTDGLPINIIDGDSVQLVVDDTVRNDQVFSQILIDKRVENIKDNALNLQRQVYQDLGIAMAQLQQAQNVLSSLTYNPTCDAFFGELKKITAACTILDSFELADISFPKLHSSMSQELESKLRAVSTTLHHLASMAEEIRPGSKSAERDIMVDTYLLSITTKVLRQLIEISQSTMKGVSTPPPAVAKRLASASRVISLLNFAIKQEKLTVSSVNRIEIYEMEYNRLTSRLNSECTTVECPVKGKVYYTDEKCLPFIN